MYWWKETREKLTKEERDQSMKDAKDVTLDGILSDDEKQAYRMFRYRLPNVGRRRCKLATPRTLNPAKYHGLAGTLMPTTMAC